MACYLQQIVQSIGTAQGQAITHALYMHAGHNQSSALSPRLLSGCLVPVMTLNSVEFLFFFSLFFSLIRCQLEC